LPNGFGFISNSPSEPLSWKGGSLGEFALPSTVVSNGWKPAHSKLLREEEFDTPPYEFTFTSMKHLNTALKENPFIGIWKDRNEIKDVDGYIRGIREDRFAEISDIRDQMGFVS